MRQLGQKLDNKIHTMYLFIVIYRIILDIIYTSQLSTIFHYSGFATTVHIELLLISWVLVFVSFPTIKRCVVQGNFSDVIMLFLILLSFLPFTTMVAFFNFTASYILANSIYWIMMFLLLRFLPKSDRSFAIETKDNDAILLIIEMVFVLTILYISWQYTGFRFTFSLSDVYTYRAEAKLASMPTILSYLFAASKAVNPILLVYHLNQKKHINAVIIFVMQILSFSFNGSKTVLFSTVSVIVFNYIYDKKYLKYIPACLAGLCCVSYLETALFNGIYILSFFIRRVLFLPNQLGYLYYDFFSKNEPDYYRQSFLRLLGFKSPYSDIDHVIGAEYFHRAEMGANNGLISDAITNWGIIGIFIMPIIIVLVLRSLDKCAFGIDKKIYIVTSVTFAFIIMSSFLPTVLLTHGLLVLGIVLMLLPRDNNASKKEGESV